MKSVAVVLLAASASAALAAPLTLPEAQRRALERSRQVVASDAVIASSREMAIAAGQLPDPLLRLGVDNVPTEGADKFSLTRDFMTMRRIGLMQEFTRSEKRQLRRERYELEAEKGMAERDATLASIQRDAAVAWLDRFNLEAMLRGARQFIEASELEVDSADSAYRSGRGTQADVFMARAAVALAKDRESDIARRLRSAKIELSRWTGSSSDEPLASAPEMTRVPLESGPLETHLSTHPEIVALDRQAKVSDKEARIADAAKRPDWTWEASYQQRGPAYSNMFSVGVSVPLPWDTGSRQDREVAAKAAMAEDARARRDEMLRAHVAEVAAMLEEWRTGRERQNRYRDEILPLSSERTAAVTSAYAGGKATLAEVLAARRNETEMFLQSVQLDLEVARLWARLNFLLPDLSLHAAAVHRSNPQ